jgi:hypothetical protein
VRGNTVDSSGSRYDEFRTGYIKTTGFSAFGGLIVSHGYKNDPSGDWTYWARLSKFQNTGRFGGMYSAAAGAGRSDPNVTDGEFGVQWFTGAVDGQQYNNALLLEADVYNDVAGYEWQHHSYDDGFVITGLDPVTVQIDLKMQVSQGGTRIDFFYRINSNLASGWVLWQTTTLPVGIPPMLSMFEELCTVSVDTWLMTSQVDYNMDGIVNMADLAVFSQMWLTNSFSPGWKSYMDINATPDGVINMKDFAVFAQRWMKQFMHY